MKYINRARMGIELFFDQLSDLTVASSTDTPEDCVEILQQQPYTAQMEECRRIQGALRRLMSARYALKEMLPARVQMVATSQFTPTPDRLLPVFQWVQELQKPTRRRAFSGSTRCKTSDTGWANRPERFYRHFQIWQRSAFRCWRRTTR